LAESGEQAVAFLKKQPVDLVLIDMLMEPGMNGRQTYQEIVRLHPGQKAIIVSGFSESHDAKVALKLGAKGFLKKPYSIEQLGMAVKESLSGG
jgi:YesN/AraC family two-component response regulator